MKNLGFLSFGHWGNYPGSQTRTAADSLLQAIDLAQAAEDIGFQGAYFRVHHFARQQASPFPLLAAIAAKTSTLHMGTGVIDMRYENPLYMAEEAAATDLIAQGRLELGVSRGSPETALRGYEAFGYTAQDKERGSDMARAKIDDFLAAIDGVGIAEADPKMATKGTKLAIEPQSETLRQRIWWGAATRDTAVWAAQKGMQLMSSTLLTEDTGQPFDQLQAEQIRMFKAAWQEADWGWAPTTTVTRSVIPLVSDADRRYFGIEAMRENSDQLGYIDGFLSRFGKTYTDEPEIVAAQLANDEAVREADTLLVTLPNQLGVAYNTELMRNIMDVVRPMSQS